MNIWRVPYPKFGQGSCLTRLPQIAARLGLDLASFGASGAVIVGSNGKGSTAAMTAALLRSRGVGLFTSPHLFDLNERFRVDGEDISDDELGGHWERARGAVDASGHAEAIGGFEFLFLIAADWFAARGVAHTVWEAGIGGRLDPVRLIQAQRVVLTSLDLEHSRLLGATLEDIARDKIDAAPQGASLFVSQSCASLRPDIEAHADAHGLRVQWFGASDLGAVPAPFAGEHQRENAALALSLARDLTPISDREAVIALAATRWPGRLETINEDPLIVIDVGHTPAAIARALDGFLALRGDRDAILICGASEDKDAAAIIAALTPGFSTIIAAAAAHKGTPAAQIAALASAANSEAEIVVAETVADARRIALARAENAAIYVAGGLFLAAEFKAIHQGRDPARLVFF